MEQQTINKYREMKGEKRMEMVIGMGVFLVLLILIVCVGYVKAPPDTAYMISGFRKPRILIGRDPHPVPGAAG